jgi:hypothetical protein
MPSRLPHPSLTRRLSYTSTRQAVKSMSIHGAKTCINESSWRGKRINYQDWTRRVNIEFFSLSDYQKICQSSCRYRYTQFLILARIYDRCFVYCTLLAINYRDADGVNSPFPWSRNPDYSPLISNVAIAEIAKTR